MRASITKPRSATSARTASRDVPKPGVVKILAARYAPVVVVVAEGKNGLAGGTAATGTQPAGPNPDYVGRRNGRPYQAGQRKARRLVDAGLGRGRVQPAWPDGTTACRG